MPSVRDVEEELVEMGFKGFCDGCGELIKESQDCCPRCGKSI